VCHGYLADETSFTTRLAYLILACLNLAYLDFVSSYNGLLFVFYMPQKGKHKNIMTKKILIS
jgi:hypothetical protein